MPGSAHLHSARLSGLRGERAAVSELNTGGLEELAGLVHFHVGAWQDFGYEKPPAADSASIPPLGERSANAIKAGHDAVGDIDQLIARLHGVRAQLVSELRRDEDIRMARTETRPDPLS